MKRILVLFDIDGTILKLRNYRSRHIFKQLYRDVFGIEIDDGKMPDFAGNTDLRILREMAESHGISYSEIVKDIDSIWARILGEFRYWCNTDNLVLLPGAEMLIKSLDAVENVSLGLLTGNFRDNAYLKLDVFKLSGYFPFGAFGDDREDRNDLPGVALGRAEEYCQYKFGIKDTIIIGDSPRDIECGKKNRIPVLSVATGGFSADLLAIESPELLFEDFADYHNVIGSIKNYFGIG